MDVSVIIVSYNAAAYLKECLESILKFTKNSSYEIIVVDNASTDDSVTVANELKVQISRNAKFLPMAQSEKLKVVQNKDNRGYAAGVNTGLKIAAGKYVLILNPDIRFLEDTISKMTAYLGQHPEVGLAGCALLDNDQKLLPNGGYFPTLTRLFFWTFFMKVGNDYHPRPNLYTRDFYPDWVTGGLMFVRREVIFGENGKNDSMPVSSGRGKLAEGRGVGLLDENIFLYGEEVEWQYRIQLAGYKIGYTTSTKIIHYERQSSGGSPRNAILGEFRGLEYIYGKYFPGRKQVVLGFLLDIAASLRIIMWLIRLKPTMAKIYLEALTV